MSPPKFRVYRAQQRPDPDASSSEAEMGQAELGAADKLSIYSLLEESGVFAHRPLGKRGLAGPVLGHKSCLHSAPGPRSGSRAGPQQPALDRASACCWGMALGTKGLLSRLHRLLRLSHQVASRLLLMLVANPAPIHKASRIASRGPSVAWHPPVGSSCHPVPRNHDVLGVPHSSAFISCCSATQSCPTLCNPVDCSTPGIPVLHYLLEFAQIHVH